MSREIKFRAWDRTRKCFIHVPDIKDLLFSYGNNYDYTKGDDVELTQYTGLKDVNEVEIYEKHIVSVAGLGNAEVIIDPFLGVCFRKDGFDSAYIDHASEQDFPTIIGNIYEHPHLLEES